MHFIKLNQVLVALFCTFLFQSVLAQKETNNWYFGRYAGLSFSSGGPVALTNGALNSFEGCAAVSDPNGNLMLYTDGLTVWNKNHISMPNGTGLNGDSSSTQSAVIVLKPGSSTLYYIFTTDAFSEPGGLSYSIVDMALQGGLGDVSTKNTFLKGTMTEKLTSVKHANGTDYWIIAHESNTKNFFSYLLTSSGLNPSPTQSSVGDAHINMIGYMKASHNGEKLAVAISFDTGNKTQLFDFNNSTGIVSNPVDYAFTSSYGIEFSPNDKFLYVSTFFGNDILYQVDLTTNTTTILASTTGNYIYGALQLAPDGKIYMARPGQSYLDCINNPDVAGTGSNYVNNAVSLAGRKNTNGLPSFAQSLFSPQSCSVSISAPDNPDLTACNGDTVTFEAPSGFVKYYWSHASQPLAIVDSSGPTFRKVINNLATNGATLKVIDSSGCEATATLNLTVRELPLIISSATPDSICPGASVTLEAEGTDDFEWKLLDGTIISNNSTTTVNPFTTTTYVVTGIDFFECKSSDTLIVTAHPTDVQILTISDSVCYGSRAQLIATGADTYTWRIKNDLTILATTQGYAPLPLTDTIYIVTGTNSLGCSSNDS